MQRTFISRLSKLLLLACLLLPAPMLAQAGLSTGSRTLFGVDPQLSDAQRALARGQERRAIRYAKQVLRMSGRTRDRRDAYSMLCQLHRERGALEESLHACDRALRLTRGDDWRVHANRAETLLGMGRRQESARDLRVAIALLENDVERSWRPRAHQRERLAALESVLLHVAHRAPTGPASASLRR